MYQILGFIDERKVRVVSDMATKKFILHIHVLCPGRLPYVVSTKDLVMADLKFICFISQFCPIIILAKRQSI